MICAIILAVVAQFSSQSPEHYLSLQETYASFANYLLTGDIANSEWQEPDQSNDYITMPDYEFYQQVYFTNDAQYFSMLDNLFVTLVEKYHAEQMQFDENQREQWDDFMRTFHKTRTKYTNQDSSILDKTLSADDNEREEDDEEEEIFELTQSYMVNTVQQNCWRMLELILPNGEENNA